MPRRGQAVRIDLPDPTWRVCVCGMLDFRGGPDRLLRVLRYLQVVTYLRTCAYQFGLAPDGPLASGFTGAVPPGFPLRVPFPVATSTLISFWILAGGSPGQCL